jgi:hypothetical protein
VEVEVVVVDSPLEMEPAVGVVAGMEPTVGVVAGMDLLVHEPTSRM